MNLFVWNVRNHQWLRHPHAVGNRSFHVYLQTHKGAESFCKKSPEITNIGNMILPGSYSPCCIDCMTKLYGIKPHIFKEDVK